MAEFKVGDKVRYRGKIAEVVDPRLYGKKVQDGYVYIEYYDKNEKSYCGEGVKKTDLVAANFRALNAKFKVGDKVRVHSPGYRANGAEGSILMVYLSGNPQKYLVDFGDGAHSEMTETSLVAANSSIASSHAINDKWIDDFHVIVTSGKPDASLLSALKEKATAWKLSKKNFSDRTAADRHNAAESKVYDIARRLGAKVIQQGAVMKVVMPNSSVCNSTNAARSPLYTGKSREVIDKITQGKYIGGAVGTVYYNPNGPFKWMINSSGWVYVAQPSRLNVLGDRRFGWKVFRVEKDGMLKQTNYHDFDSIQEAQRAFDELKSINSTNPVVRKALNAVACNSSIDDSLAEAERNKYDSVVLFQKVIGSGTLFPDKFKLDGGYDCEDAVRAAVKTGKYNEAIFYKNGAIKKRIGLNSAN